MKPSYYTADYYRRRNEKKFSEMSAVSKIGIILSFVFSLSAMALVILYFINQNPMNLPTVVSVENYNSTPISYSEILSGDLISNYPHKAELEFSEVRHIFKVTLSDGQEYFISSNPGMTKLKGTDFYIRLETTADLEECTEAFENGKDTVTVDITATIGRSYHATRKNTISSFTASVKRELTEKIIKEIKPTDSSPLAVYADSDECSFVGREFEITYSDGRKVTDTVKLTTDTSLDAIQELDGHPIRTYYDGEGEAYFYFYDYEGTVKTEMKPFPFKSIEITDCVLDEEYNVKTLSYNITRTDGTTESYTKELFYSSFSYYYVFDVLDGYEISVKRRVLYPKLFGDIEIEVTASAGIVSENIEPAVFTPELPISDCSCICHRNMAYSKYCYRVKYFFEDFFYLNKKCKCGITHSDLS